MILPPVFPAACPACSSTDIVFSDAAMENEFPPITVPYIYWMHCNTCGVGTV